MNSGVRFRRAPAPAVPTARQLVTSYSYDAASRLTSIRCILSGTTWSVTFATGWGASPAATAQLPGEVSRHADFVRHRLRALRTARCIATFGNGISEDPHVRPGLPADRSGGGGKRPGSEPDLTATTAPTT